MTSPDLAQGVRSADSNQSPPPLLHLRGTEYGLRIHGFPLAERGPFDTGLGKVW